MIRYIMENALNTNKSWLCAAILIIATSTSSIADAANNKPINGKVYISANYGVGIANKFDYDEELQVVRPKNSQIFGLSLGYKFNDNIRAELAFNRFHKFKYEDNIKYNDNENPHIFHYRNQKISSNALFANFYFDINKFKKFAPYVNVGLGVSRNKAGDFSNTVVQEHNVKDEVWLEKKSQNKFAWNVGAGVGYNISNKVSLDLINYKYYNLGQVATKEGISYDEENNEVKATFKSKIKVHTINTGIRIKF